MGKLRNEGIVFGSQRARILLERHGLVSFDAVTRFGQPMHCRHRGRSMSVGELSEGDATVRIYVKQQHHALRRIPRWTDLRKGMAFSPYPVCEWRGLARFREAGFLTPEPLALLREGWYSARSAVMVEAVPCEHPLGDLVRAGRIEPLDGAARQALVDAIVGTIERIHGAGLGWRAMESRHFYPRLEPDGAWRVWLLDCEGVHRPLSRHDVRRQRRKFLDTLRADQADEGFIVEVARRLGLGTTAAAAIRT